MMSNRSFYFQLGSITLGTFLILCILHQFPNFQLYSGFSWLSLGFFILLSILMFRIGIVSVNSSDRNAFSRTVLGFIAGKMFLSVLIVVVYVEWTQPDSRHFIIPFLIVYLIYTVFETHFMMKMGRMKPKKEMQ